MLRNKKAQSSANLGRHNNYNTTTRTSDNNRDKQDRRVQFSQSNDNNATDQSGSGSKRGLGGSMRNMVRSFRHKKHPDEHATDRLRPVREDDDHHDRTAASSGATTTATATSSSKLHSVKNENREAHHESGAPAPKKTQNRRGSDGVGIGIGDVGKRIRIGRGAASARTVQEDTKAATSKAATSSSSSPYLSSRAKSSPNIMGRKTAGGGNKPNYSDDGIRVRAGGGPDSHNNTSATATASATSDNNNSRFNFQRRNNTSNNNNSASPRAASKHGERRGSGPGIGIGDIGKRIRIGRGWNDQRTEEQPASTSASTATSRTPPRATTSTPAPAPQSAPKERKSSIRVTSVLGGGQTTDDGIRVHKGYEGDGIRVRSG